MIIQQHAADYSGRQLTLFTECESGRTENTQAFSSGRMSPVLSHLIKGEILKQSLKKSDKIVFQYLDLTNGREREWLNFRPVELNGGSWMRSIGESHKDAEESSLSRILQPLDGVPAKYYLSARACKGILRRAKDRRKELSSGATGSAHQTGVTLGFSTQSSIKDSNPILEECTPTMRGSVRLGVLSTKDMVFENHGRDARIRGPLTKGPAITAYAGTGGNNLPLVSHCLIVNQGAQNDGKGEDGNTEATCYANSSYSTWEKSNICATQRATGGILGGGSDTLVHVKAIDCRNFRETITSGTLQSKASGGYSLNFQNPIRLGSIVRRMTPLECERLQGLPDGWTLIKDKTCSDSARYKALGNGMAQPCADWIIKRIVEAMLNSKG